MLKRFIATGMSLLLATGSFPSVSAAASMDTDSIKVGINADVTFQTIDNFGASDAWSMDPIGKGWSDSNKEKIADLLFSTDKGIGLSSWRFNIGAGSDKTDESIITNPWRRAESFKTDENSDYDWSRQSGQQWFLKAASDRGVQDLIAFVNSPPVWMTKNGHAQPDASVGSTNLKAGYEGTFAKYLADILDHFNNSGIHFNYISPVNEPTWDWNGAGQEGNRYNNEDLVNVISTLYSELQERKLTTKITAPEGVEILSLLDDQKYAEFMNTTKNSGSSAAYQGGSNTAGTGKYREYIKDFLGNPEIAHKIDNKIDYHSYWSDTVSNDNGDRLIYLRQLLQKNLQDTLPGATSWMSEYSILGNVGEMDGSGRDLGIDPALLIARTIYADLSVANASAWQWWTAVSNVDYKDGLIYTDYSMPGDEQTIYPSKMLWALGNYSKFIRPGAKRVEMTGLAENDPYGLMGSAYLNESSHTITSVYVNYSNEDKPVTVQMNQLPGNDEVYHLTPYVTSESEDLSQHDMITADANGAFQYTIPARSIVTLDGSYAPADQVPNKPVVESVKALNKAAEIKVGDVAAAESYTIQYGISSDNLNKTVSVATGETLLLTGLENKTTYYFKVIAVNKNGESAASDLETVMPALSPPEQVTVFSEDGGIGVQFTGDPSVPEYWVKWGTQSGNYTKKVEIKGQNGIYKGSITGLTNGSTYYVAVEAQDGEELSGVSSEQTVIPTIEAPGKLIAVPGNNQVHLEFTDVQGSNGYILEMQANNETPATLHLQTNDTTISDLTNGKSYTFRVTSEGKGGAGKPSEAVKATPKNENVTWEDDFQNDSISSYSQDVSSWAVEEGLVKQISGGDNRGELSVNNVKIIDGSITATAKHTSLGADWGVVFRGTSYQHAYTFGYENNALVLRKDGVNLDKAKAFSAKLNQLYQLKVVLDGPHIQAYMDGELIFDVQDPTYSSGMAGLHSWGDAEFSYMKVNRADDMTKAPEIYSIRSGSHQIELKYKEVDGATSYTVYYGTSPDTLNEQVTGGEGSATIEGLGNNEVYYFKVVASNGKIQTESSVKSGSPRDIQDPQLLYYVDAGDGSPAMLEGGESFGLLNGVEDQPYGVDSITGKTWGYVADGDATWAKTDGSDNYQTIRQYDGDESGKGLAYKFSLPNGTYRVTVGLYDPWKDSTRKMDLTINGTTELADYVNGGTPEAKAFDSVSVTDGQLEVKVLKKSGSKPMLSWIKVEKDLLYYVDAGDSSVDKLEADEEFGLRNSKEEQPYQEDPATGYKWGYEADDSQSWANQNEDRWNSVRQYDGTSNDKGLSYRFEVPDGQYKLELGFDDPWNSSDRTMDVEVEGQKALTTYLIGAGQDSKRVVGVTVTDGELNVKVVKKGNSKPLISWIKVEHDNGTPDRPAIKNVTEADSKVTLYFDETINASYDVAYGTEQGNLNHHVSIPGNENHFTVDNLTNGTLYYFAMSTVRGDVTGTRSEVKTATPVGPADPDLYYFVDAGSAAALSGVTLGAKQSVPDQSFGQDPVTGETWGYVADDGLTWANTDEPGLDPFLSIRQYDGNDTGKGLAYKFDVPNGTYTVQMGFDDPWDSPTRTMDIYIQNERKLEGYVVGDKRETQTFTVDVINGQLEVKAVKAGGDKPMIGWISVRKGQTQPDPVVPKLWYKFDEGSGTTVNDASGNGHSGTLSEGASWGTAKNGSGAVTLNGTNGYVQLPDGIMANMNDITVSTNVYIDPTISIPYWIFTFGSAQDPGSAAGTKYFGMLTDRESNSRVTITNDRWSAEQNASKGNALTTGVWKNVAVTLSGSTMIFYEDGIKVAEKTDVTISPKDMEATIANYIGKPAYPSDQYLKGQVSDFRIYDRALSAEAIKNVWIESLSDDEAVQAVKAGLDLGDTTAVINNLTLPTVFPAGVSVTWSSDRTDIINDAGTVTRPTDADTTVHLTANLSKGSAVETKTFTLTVLKIGDVTTLDNRSYTLSLNQIHQTKLTVTHPDGTVDDLTAEAEYESSDPNVAAVDASGKVTGVHVGTAEILVTYGGHIYQVTVTVKNDMVLWYKLDDPNKDIAVDSSGNGNDGLLKNGAAWGEGIGGGSSLQLNGGNNGGYVQMPDELLQNVDDLTISAFMKLDMAATAPQWLATFGKTSNGYIYFAPTLSGKYRYSITPTNWSGETGVASDSISVNSWRQVAVTYSSVTGTATLYVDGVAVQSGKVFQKPGSLEPTNANFIGKPWPNYPDQYFKGNISDFRVYSRALDATEILDIYGGKAEEMFTADQQALTLGDISAVKDNLVLPNRGLYGSTITWTSSDETVFNSKTGAVTRPEADAGDAEITLTATIRRGDAVVTKSFVATVLKQPADIVKLKLDAEDLAVYNIGDVRGNLTLPTKGENGSSISWSSGNPTVITSSGEVNRPAHGSGDLDVKLTATLKLNGIAITKAFLAHVKELPVKSKYAGYLFSYFIGEGTEDGEQLYLATSNGNDPLHWSNLNGGKPVFISDLGEKGVRDPSIVRSPDGDKFYMIATDLKIYGNGDWTGAQTTGSTSLLIWESPDLIHWSKLRMVKVSSDLAGNTWAPESFYDKTTGEYVVFWASKIYSDSSKSGSPNERIMYAKTRDFYTFTEAKEYINPGYSVIDTTMIEHEGKIYRFTKDERDHNDATAPNGKMVYEEVGDSVFSDFTLIKEGIGKGTIPVGEGPLAFKANDEDKWYLFIDYFSGGGYKPFYTTDLNSGVWTPVTSGYSLPDPAPRHGTVLPVTAEELARINETVPVEVAPAESEVTEVTLDQTAVTLNPGATAQLKATVLPDVASNKNVLWSSSNEEVVSVDESGTLTGKAVGTAIVTATSVDGGKMATAEISVRKSNVSVTGISLDKNEATLQAGETVSLAAIITPVNATNKTVRFTSSSTKVATVTNVVYHEDTGKTSVVVTGVAEGKATITATTDDGGKTSAFTVIVLGSGNAITPNKPETTGNATPGKVNIGTVTVESATATVRIDSVALTKALKETNVAVIEVPKADVQAYEVHLPGASLIADESKKLIISTEFATLEVPLDMLRNTPSVRTGDIALIISKEDTSGLAADTKVSIGSRPVIGLSLKVNGSMISWNNPESPVRVSIPYTPSSEELKNPEYIVIWYLDDRGQLSAVPSGKFNSAAGSITFKTTHFSKYAAAYVHKSYRDLTGYGWAQKSIEVMGSKGVIQGTSKDTFNPASDITRADFVQLLVRTLGLNAPKSVNPFNDINSSAYYAEAVAVANQLGIVTGVEEGRFDPKSKITRQDMMVMIERALKVAEIEPAEAAEVKLSNFTDQADVASYASQSISKLINSGIVTGDGSRINPRGNATRAEAAVLMYRIYNFAQ